MYKGRFISPIIISIIEVILVYIYESRARIQHVLNPIGLIYTSDYVYIFYIYI